MLGIKNYPTSDDSGNERLLTMASGPVIVEDNKVLLDKHGDDNYWKFPGGTMAQDDSFRANAEREVMEELGLEVILEEGEPFVMDIQKEKDGKPLTIILFHYYASRQTETITPGRDVREYAWHDIDDLPADCAMNIRPAVEYFRNKGCY
ncbi:MAG: NUDIX hydrolase [Candidatus Gracilibacteria bacterium]